MIHLYHFIIYFTSIWIVYFKHGMKFWIITSKLCGHIGCENLEPFLKKIIEQFWNWFSINLVHYNNIAWDYRIYRTGPATGRKTVRSWRFIISIPSDWPSQENLNVFLFRSTTRQPIRTFIVILFAAPSRSMSLSLCQLSMKAIFRIGC